MPNRGDNDKVVSRSAEDAAGSSRAAAGSSFPSEEQHQGRTRHHADDANRHSNAPRAASESGASDDVAATGNAAASAPRRAAGDAAGGSLHPAAHPATARSASQRRLLASRAGVALTIAPPPSAADAAVPSGSKAGEDDGVCLLASPAPANFGGARGGGCGGAPVVPSSPPPASTPSLILMVDGDVVTRRPGRHLGGSRPLPPWMLEEREAEEAAARAAAAAATAAGAVPTAAAAPNHPPRGTAAVFLSTDHAPRRLAVGGGGSGVRGGNGRHRPHQRGPAESGGGGGETSGWQHQQQQRPGGGAHLHHLSAVTYANDHRPLAPPRFAAFGGGGGDEGAPGGAGTAGTSPSKRRSPSPPNARGGGGGAGAAAAVLVTATAHLLPAPRTPLRAALAAPLPTLTRELEARIQSLGTELPKTHRAILWAGVALDVASKAAAAAQLARFARDGSWVGLGSLAAFVALSSAAVTGYWLTHYYPGAFAERAARAARAKKQQSGGSRGLGRDGPPAAASPSPSPPREKSPRGLLLTLQQRKGAAAAARASPPPPGTAAAADASGSWAARRAWVRRAGTAAAALQLGTAFAAARALRASEVRQRAVAMELRGMRLADTVFLTLGVACLNAWAQVRCAAPGTPCAPGGGRAALRLASVAGAVASAAMCHLALEMNDRRLAAGDRLHAAQLTALTVYRAAEAGARVALLAVFAGVFGAWLFAVVGVHAAATLLLLRLQPRRPRGDDCALAAAGAAGALAPSLVVLGPRPWDKVFAPARAPGWWRRWLLRLSREREAMKKKRQRREEQEQQQQQRLSPSPSPKDQERRHSSAFDRADAAVQAAAATLGGGAREGANDDPENGDNDDGDGLAPALRTSAETDRTLLPRPPLPRTTDACLLAACLAWPPSFYVSDATDAGGRFWWRARMLGRRSCADVRPARSLVPFWAYTLLVAAEAAVMLGVLVALAPSWAAPYVAGAQLAHAAWGLAAALWLAVEVASAAEGRDAALDRLAAGRDAEAMLQEMEAEAEAAAEAEGATAAAEERERKLGVGGGVRGGGGALGVRKLSAVVPQGDEVEEETTITTTSSSSPSATPQRLLRASEGAPLSSSCNADASATVAGAAGGAPALASPEGRRLASDSGVAPSSGGGGEVSIMYPPPDVLFPLRTSWGRRSSGSSGSGR